MLASSEWLQVHLFPFWAETCPTRTSAAIVTPRLSPIFILKIKFVEESKFGKKLQEDIQVSQLVVGDQENIKKLEFLNSFDFYQAIVLTVEFFNSKV